MIFTPDKCQKEPNGIKLGDAAQARARRPPQPVGSTLLLCEGLPTSLRQSVQINMHTSLESTACYTTRLLSWHQFLRQEP